ncbi:uncharacterized protein FOMMEDRAFT_157542 [Fomitiporia mediterranea MF3/22]|uniref:uncharacterized protein n=1 Tax=Fomitiporia mediterranea (strain MF3/22) TaxID=694068 RepID=UPI0004408863|nr:uncharacterized protein FOMMEDRAFT_157542 [Fomitiporia mediterranea MF3/22]EJD02325.1 hypothetical protein FOMMEDRAFT_157542 [Fomitiporia mediterranea MF3/22]
MNSVRALPMFRSSSQSTDPDSEVVVGCYRRTDEPCMLTFRVGDPVWARIDGVWSLGVVISDCYLQQGKCGGRPIPTHTVLTRVGSLSAPLTPIPLSTLFGTLKPVDTYMASLLHAEGKFPSYGNDRAIVLDLQMTARQWMEQWRREAKARRGGR